MKKATIITYGCQMNVNDSIKLRTMLKNCGFEIINDIRDSDLVLLNTCTIRGSSSEKIYGKLGELKTIKKEKKDMIIVVAGCLAQEKKYELIEDNPHVEIVIGNQNMHKLPAYIESIESKRFSHAVLVDREDELPARMEAEFESTSTALVSITYGCNNFCSYCIVPYVRGRERSVPYDDIIKEVKDFVNEGFKEIVLLGQNVNSYGKDLENTNFAKLLQGICDIEGKFRIRFASPHPRDFTDELIATIAANEKVCKNIHLPLQAGSTKILKAMNRGYTKDGYLRLVDKIRAGIPDVSITTDIIVGFPGEELEDFEDTIDVVKKARFENAYMFMYSVRSGTAAEKMENHISDDLKSQRLQELMSIQNHIAKAESDRYLNKICEVLVEGPTVKNKEMLTGRTDTNKIVIFKGNESDLGKFVNIKITDSRTWTLYGEIERG